MLNLDILLVSYEWVIINKQLVFLVVNVHWVFVRLDRLRELATVATFSHITHTHNLTMCVLHRGTTLLPKHHL